MNEPLVVAGAVGVVLLVGVAIALIAGAKKKIRESYEKFAASRGLTCKLGAFPWAEGEVDGRRVYVGNEMGRRPGDVVQFVIRIELRGAVPVVFMAMPRKLLTGAGKIATGDAAFDAKVWVAGEDENAIRAYLGPQRRQAILELTAMGGWIVGAKAAILRGLPEVAWAKTGMKPDPRWLEERFADLARFAPRLDG